MINSERTDPCGAGARSAEQRAAYHKIKMHRLWNVARQKGAEYTYQYGSLQHYTKKAYRVPVGSISGRACAAGCTGILSAALRSLFRYFYLDRDGLGAVDPAQDQSAAGPHPSDICFSRHVHAVCAAANEIFLFPV